MVIVYARELNISPKAWHYRQMKAPTPPQSLVQSVKCVSVMPHEAVFKYAVSHHLLPAGRTGITA